MRELVCKATGFTSQYIVKDEECIDQTICFSLECVILVYNLATCGHQQRSQNNYTEKDRTCWFLLSIAQIKAHTPILDRSIRFLAETFLLDTETANCINMSILSLHHRHFFYQFFFNQSVYLFLMDVHSYSFFGTWNDITITDYSFS